MSLHGAKRVRYAVVGAGNIAQVAVLPAFEHAAENSELAAIASGDAEKREALGARYGVPTCPYEDLEAIVAREHIDALYVTLPNTRHREFVERGARARTHVLCEKPLAMTSEDCRAMVEACEAAGVHLMPAYRLHFEEANVRAMEIVRSGRIGKPRYFSACFSQQVRAIPYDDGAWMSVFDELVATVSRHVEEEEGEYFPSASRALGKTATEAMTARYEAKKASVMRGRTTCRPCSGSSRAGGTRASRA